ncbi:MAG: hypothetical protein JST68_01185 [Bacteroidetes bacterium]|nr:hypothetical protein [Bacteroidota bacterium]
MNNDFADLLDFIEKVPAIKVGIGSGHYEDGLWWIKFKIDIDHPLAWNVVQELGNIINYLSINDRLPTRFYPVSPPSYLNGGPKDFLSWIIESTNQDFSPMLLAEWLEARMPRPVDDLSQWVREES